MKKSGFGILEALVAITLSGIAIYGLTSVITWSLNHTRYLQAKNDFLRLSSQLETTLKNTAVCSASLYNGQATPTRAKFQPTLSISPTDKLQEIKIGVQSIVKLGMVTNTFTISTLSLTEVTGAPRTSLAGGQTLYIANFLMEGTKINVKGAPILKHTALLNVISDDATGEITQCSMQGLDVSPVPSVASSPSPSTAASPSPSTSPAPANYPITMLYGCQAYGNLSNGTQLYTLFSTATAPDGSGPVGGPYVQWLKLADCDAQRINLQARRSQITNSNQAVFMCTCHAGQNSNYSTPATARLSGVTFNNYNAMMPHPTWMDMGSCNSSMATCISTALSYMP